MSETRARKGREPGPISRGSLAHHADALGLGWLRDVEFGVERGEGSVHHIGWSFHVPATWSGSTLVPTGPGVWHSRSPWCARRVRGAAPIPETLPLAALPEKRCGTCTHLLHPDVSQFSERPEELAAAVMAAGLSQLREEISRAADVPKKITPSALQQRLQRVRSAPRRIEELTRASEQIFTPASSPHEWSQAASLAREVLESEIETARAALSARFEASATSEAILQQIRDALYGAGSTISIDETPTLVGLPQRAYIKGRIASAVLATYALECAQGRVLLVPRYIADWVLCNLQAGSQCAQTTSAPEDPEQARLAAQLWDPGSEGPSRSLRDMVTAAAEVLSCE